MISIDVTVTGGEIGSKLADNPEEMFYALEALSREASPDFESDVADYADATDAPKIVAFLRSMADQIEASA